MKTLTLQVGNKLIVERKNFDLLLEAISKRGYQILGPTVREGAIVYDEIRAAADLPIGWTDEQEGGVYRLKKRGDQALFGYVVGPYSWKRFLHPPIQRLWKAEKKENGFQVIEEKEDAPKMAFFGARSCEIHAIAIQDKVFLNGKFTDPIYQGRRENILVVAVQCGQAGKTCFCVSMKTGPKASFGFDLALTEILDEQGHRFVVEVGSQKGVEILADVPHEAAPRAETAKAEEIVHKTAGQMGRKMETGGIKELLYRNFDNARWDQVATRCVNCANCTMACPTCFCTTVEDVTDLTGDHAERWRKWDSCFTMDFSYLHGGSVRAKAKSRYRQWLTHKLGTWIDQFQTSGCVGCGRCITWCPVGIDITEEVAAIRESEKKEKSDGKT